MTISSGFAQFGAAGKAPTQPTKPLTLADITPDLAKWKLPVAAGMVLLSASAVVLHALERVTAFN